MKKREWGAMSKVLFKPLLVAFFILGNGLLASAQVRVVDAESGNPVSYASIFDDATGKVLGITSSDGFLPSGAESCKTISVQHINYEPVTVGVSSVEDKTIKLTIREAYQMPEVTVSKTEHDYMRLKFYTRQYTIMNGVVAAVSESLDYGYYDAQKQYLKETLLLSQRLLRNEALLVGQPKLIMKAGRIGKSLPGGSIASKLREFASYDEGKKYPMIMFGHKYWVNYVKRDVNAKRIEYIRDSIYVYKPFNFKLFGVTLSDGYEASTFSTVYGKPSLSTWQNTIFSMRITHNKTKSSVTKYIESYVLEAEYADKADYKALKKELKQKAKTVSSAHFERPQGFLGFNKYVTDAMKNMTVVSE